LRRRGNLTPQQEFASKLIEDLLTEAVTKTRKLGQRVSRPALAASEFHDLLSATDTRQERNSAAAKEKDGEGATSCIPTQVHEPRTGQPVEIL